MVFHWSLSDGKSPQLSRTLLSILAVLNNAVVWMVSTRSPTSKSFSPFNNPLVIVPKASITIGIIVIFMSHSFFSSFRDSKIYNFANSLFFCWFLRLVEVLLFTFFQFYSVVSRDSKIYNFANSLFCCWFLRLVEVLLFTFFQFYSVVSRDSKIYNFANSLFCCWLLLGLLFWPRLGDPFVCQSPIGVYTCHFIEQLLGCTYAIYSYAQI